MRWTEYQGRGFFCRDGLLEVWLALVVDELDRRRSETEPWMRSLRDDFQVQAMVSFDGLVETRLDVHVASEGQRRALVELCHDLRRRLRRGERPEGPLADRVGASRWGRPDTLAGLARLADSFVWLLEETAS